MRPVSPSSSLCSSRSTWIVPSCQPLRSAYMRNVIAVQAPRPASSSSYGDGPVSVPPRDAGSSAFSGWRPARTAVAYPAALSSTACAMRGMGPLLAEQIVGSQCTPGTCRVKQALLKPGDGPGFTRRRGRLSRRRLSCECNIILRTTRRKTSMQRSQPFTLAVPFNHSDHALGPAWAKVTVVEYGDFECPSCGQAYPAVKMLLRHFGDRVRFVFRHFPLVEVHPHAELAAEAAEAAGAQHRFWPMHDLLFEHQQHLKAISLRQYALQAELDLDRYDYEMNEHVYLQRVHEHIDGGAKSGVRSTPGFFVNGAVQDVSFTAPLTKNPGVDRTPLFAPPSMCSCTRCR